VLANFLSAVRRGNGRSLVLRGEAGIAKTALLEYLLESATDLADARPALRASAAAKRRALEIVFGLCAGAAPDRFFTAWQ
jgi:hypothetical protein